MIIDPKEQNAKENYMLMIGSIVPRPIALVSTTSKSGIFNVAPFSFFNGITSKPPILCFSTAFREGDLYKKDTLVNIEETGEFVVNVVTEDIVIPMNDAATEFPPHINEFEEVGLTAEKSEKVIAPRVKESPISLECKRHGIVYMGEREAGGAALITGEIILFHVADFLLKDGQVDIEKVRPVGRLAGNNYTTLGKIFSLPRNPYKPSV